MKKLKCKNEDCNGNIEALEMPTLYYSVYEDGSISTKVKDKMSLGVESFRCDECEEEFESLD